MTRRGERLRGRRPGGQSSRDDVLRAARAEFEERGFDAATVRGIAGRAGVDPAMIHHFFGTKEKLFLASMDVGLDPAFADAIAAGPRDGLGERAVRTFLTVWGIPAIRTSLLGLLRSAMTNDVAATMLRQFVTHAILRRVVVAFEGLPDAELRAEAVASQLVGLGILRYVVKVEPLASATEDELIALIGPVIQRYIPADGVSSDASSDVSPDPAP